MKLAPAKVWDVPVRLFHWTIVGLIAFSWWSAEEGGMMLKYHMWSGYAVLTLVLFRVLWGFAGSTTARFSDFVHGPAVVIAGLRDLASTRALHVPGHNPAGGWMVVLLLLCLLTQTGTGLFANDDIFNEGPLYKHVGKALSDRLTALHHLNFSVLMGLIGMHVAAIVYHRVRKGERLVGAMIHGRKPIDGPPPRLAPAWRALPWLAACAAAVAVIVNL